MDRSLTVAAILLLAVAIAAVASFAPDAAASLGGALDLHLAEPAALAALRRKLSDLETRAADMLAEIGDDTSAEDARRIETEHKEIVEEIDTVKNDIRSAEAELAAGGTGSRGDNGGESEGTPGQRQADPPSQQRPADATPPSTPLETGSGSDPRSQPLDIRGTVRQALAEERARQTEIRELAQRHSLGEAFVRRHVREESGLDAVRAAALEELERRSRQTPQFPHVETMGLQDEREVMRRGMIDGLAHRIAHAGGDRRSEPPEHARAYAGMEIVEMAAEAIGWRGQLRTARQVSDMLTRAFHATSDFPEIFTNALNVRLLARYQAAAPTYRLLAQQLTAADFREMNVIRAGDFPALQPINEGGEIRGGTFGESKEVFRVHPYGVRFQITRQMIINDQLGAIDQVLGSAGQRVADWENSKFFEVLLEGSGNGPVLRTGNRRMFHAQHGNLADSGAAISVQSVGDGRAAMAMQTTLDGIKANFQPSILLCSPTSITTAEQLLTQLTPPRQEDAVPQSLRSLTPVSDANLTGNAWYLFAEPMVAANFAYGFLEGFEGPRLTSEDIFDVQGMRVKLEHDFGVTGIDFRGAFRNPGASGD